MPNLFGTPRNLQNLGGPAGAHAGTLRNPIEESRHENFIQLESGRSDTAGSMERLVEGTSMTKYYKNAYPGQFRDPEEAGEEVEIPLHQIHVRDDIRVQESSSQNGIEPGADQTALNQRIREENMEV